LEESKPDLVHVHEPFAPSASLFALRAATVPCVGTFHASAESSLGYRAARLVLRQTADRLTIRTAVSDSARSLVARYFPGDYLLTPNGVEVDRFANARPLNLGDSKKVLFFGRIERRKGLECLIQAMTRLRDEDVKLVVAGTGPRERACRVLAARLDVDAVWLGRLSDADAAGAYRGADVFCAPNLGGESFGMVLLEAMAAGVPVVASDLAPFREVSGEAAALFPAGNPSSLGAAIRRVLRDEREATRLAQAGRTVAHGYDWSRLVAGVEGAYDLALQGQ
jgi:phosphatidylinositol alpha-mannosyltransferase